MNVTIEKLENNLVKLDIEVSAEVAAQEYNKACRKISEIVNIPGFRKGKAPRNIIEKYAGVERIKHEALDHMLPKVFADVIRENDFDVVTEPFVESFDFNVGEPVKVVAKMELKPEVKLAAYKDLELEVGEYKTPEDALDKELKNLADKFATLEPVIDRETTVNDIVIIDFNGSVDGEPIKGGSAKNYQLDLANSTFIPGFAEQIVDHKISEEFTIKVKFPEEYHEDSLKGKDAEFIIKINEIKEKIVPELNDEFAQKVGAFKTIDDLKKDITNYFEKTAEEENKKRAQNVIFDKIVETAEVDIQDSMVNREAKYLMEDVKQRVTGQGLSWEQVLDSQGHETIWNNLRTEALTRIKNSLVMSAIAKAEDIKVENTDFESKVKEMAAIYNTEDKAIYEQMVKNPALAQSLTQQILSQKISQFLVENNKVTYVEDKKTDKEEN